MVLLLACKKAWITVSVVSKSTLMQMAKVRGKSNAEQ
jgi:hypothetical protein